MTAGGAFIEVRCPLGHRFHAVHQTRVEPAIQRVSKRHAELLAATGIGRRMNVSWLASQSHVCPARASRRCVAIRSVSPRGSAGASGRSREVAELRPDGGPRLLQPEAEPHGATDLLILDAVL